MENREYENYVEMCLFIAKSLVTIVLIAFIGIQVLDNLLFAWFAFFGVGVAIAALIIGLCHYHKNGFALKKIVGAFCVVVFFPIWSWGLAAWGILKNYISPFANREEKENGT